MKECRTQPKGVGSDSEKLKRIYTFGSCGDPKGADFSELERHSIVGYRRRMRPDSMRATGQLSRQHLPGLEGGKKTHSEQVRD